MPALPGVGRWFCRWCAFRALCAGRGGGGFSCGAVGGLTNHSKTCRTGTGTAESQSQRQSKPRQRDKTLCSLPRLALSFLNSLAELQILSECATVCVLAENS